MFSKFSEEAQKVLLLAKKEMSLLKHPYVGSEHLLLSILSQTKLDVTNYLKKNNITYDLFKKEIIKIIGVGSCSNDWFLYTPLLKRVIENAILDSKEEEEEEVSVERLFISLLEEGDGVAIRVLMGMNIDIDLLYDKFSNKFIYRSSLNKGKLLIDEFGVDFTERAKNGEFDPTIGRDRELNRIIEILLRRTKNNPLLIGDAGVGKTAIIEELAKMIVDGNVPKALLNKRVVEVMMSSLVSGTKYRGEFEERISKIISELESEKDIILFIDEIHTLVGAGGAEGAIDASNILKPSLARGKIKVIGATTSEEYKKFIESDKALDRRFQKLNINEPSFEEVVKIITKLKEVYEDFHNVIISEDLVNEIVDLSSRYISKGRQPDKSIDILDEICIRTSLKDNKYEEKLKLLRLKLNNLKDNKNRAIIEHDFKSASSYKGDEIKLEHELNKLSLKQDSLAKRKEVDLDVLYDIIYEKSNIPVKDIINKNSKDIYNNIIKVIVGQDIAIKKIINTINFKLKRNIPYSFLLIGDTGVGKTLFVKEYARLFYSKSAFIRVDMSEYKESHSVSKIIGSPPGYVGYDNKKSIVERVRDNPYSIILLDEVEKGHIDVIRLFLQILDEGSIDSSSGEKIDFSNTCIFMTSNLGCKSVGMGFVNNNLNDINNKVMEFFSKEFINRIDEIILFDNLCKASIECIIKKQLSLLNCYDKTIISRIVNECEYEKFGARKIKRLIDKYYDDIIKVKVD